MADTKMAVDSEKNVFQLPIEITANGTVEKTLNTKDTYVDKNIKVSVSVPDAAFERKTLDEGYNGEISATASIASNDYTVEKAADATEDPSAYSITLQADAHVNAVTVGTKTAGFTAATDTITVDAANATQNTKTVYIKAGALSGDGSVSVAGGNGVTLTAADAAPTDGSFYIKADSSGSVSVSTAGWLPADYEAVDTSGSQIYTIQKLIFKNALATGENEDDYTAVSVAPIPVDEDGKTGYLYIKEGYLKNTKISLADLVPDATSRITSDAAAYLLSGYTAIDNDGNVITGTMQSLTNADLVFTNGTAVNGTIVTTDVTIAAKDDKSAFTLTGTHATSGSVTVTNDADGFMAKDITKTATATGTATLNMEVAKVVVAADVTDDGKVTPVIAKETGTANSTDAISTTAPTDKHYVAVSAAAIDKTINISPKVQTAGYGTTDVYGANSATATAGSAASGTYYIGIDNGSVSSDGSISGADMTTAIGFTNTASVTGTSTNGILSVAPTDGSNYITIAAAADEKSTTVSGTVTTTVTEGYVTSSNGTTKDVSTTIKASVTGANQYIKVFDGSYV